MVITIKKDGDMVVIDEQRSDDTTIKYNTDVIIKLIESAIESMVKERNG